MSDSVTRIVTEVLEQHRFYNGVQACSCNYSRDAPFEERMSAPHMDSAVWRAHVAAVVATRLAEQHAIVELPQPEQDRWGNPQFTVGCMEVTAYPRHGGYSQFKLTDPEYDCLMWWPGDMREIAAAFIAAANAAERTDRV